MNKKSWKKIFCLLFITILSRRITICIFDFTFTKILHFVICYGLSSGYSFRWQCFISKYVNISFRKMFLVTINYTFELQHQNTNYTISVGSIFSGCSYQFSPPLYTNTALFIAMPAIYFLFLFCIFCVHVEGRKKFSLRRKKNIKKCFHWGWGYSHLQDSASLLITQNRQMVLELLRKYLYKQSWQKNFFAYFRDFSGYCYSFQITLPCLAVFGWWKSNITNAFFSYGILESVPFAKLKKKELKLVDSVVLQSTRLNWTSDNANWCTKTIICHLTNDALIILIGGDVWMNRNYKGREIVYPCESVINVTKLDIAFGKMWQHITHRAE